MKLHYAPMPEKLYDNNEQPLLANNVFPKETLDQINIFQIRTERQCGDVGKVIRRL
jgi:hypothetical protein